MLWADEGFGVRCVEAMADRYAAAGDSVRLLDGGTQGLYLLPFLEEADALIVFDAVDYGLPPGTMKIVEGDEVPAFMGAKKMSLHQTGFQDVIATAQLLGRCPARMVLIGCQPVELEDYGGGLRPLVAAQIDPALQMALASAGALGRRRCGRGGPQAPIWPMPSIRREAYEAGRPSEAEACRIGDDRFFPEAVVMCLGVPMPLLSVDGIAGLASDGTETQLIDLSPGAPMRGPATGCWLSGRGARGDRRRPRRRRSRAALDGLRSLMQGGDLGDAFADLESRSRRLPPIFRPRWTRA